MIRSIPIVFVIACAPATPNTPLRELPAIEARLPAKMPARRLRTLALEPRGYDPRHGPVPSDLLLGDLLFHAPEVLGPRAAAAGISCQTCHPNGAASTIFFIDRLSDRAGNVDLTSAMFREGADDGRFDPVNIPSLRGVKATSPYGRDGRTASLSEFIQGVIASEFGGAPLDHVKLRALVRYVDELEWIPNSKLDGRGRLTPAAGERALRGERLFFEPRAAFEGGSCATCHPPSSFFSDGRVHRMFEAQPSSPFAIEGGFETPTLLGIVESAPYFHDGSLPTLAAVVDWFDERYRLSLSAEDELDLTEYLHAVGAVEMNEDRRAAGEILAEEVAVLDLLLRGDHKDDPEVWRLALSRASEALRDPPPALERESRAIRARLEILSRSEEAKSELRPEVSAIFEAIIAIAPRWSLRGG
jgi:cytochrome c peroxidase